MKLMKKQLNDGKRKMMMSLHGSQKAIPKRKIKKMVKKKKKARGAVAKGHEKLIE